VCTVDADCATGQLCTNSVCGPCAPGSTTCPTCPQGTMWNGAACT
jgi:hypothetical protein